MASSSVPGKEAKTVSECDLREERETGSSAEGEATEHCRELSKKRGLFRGVVHFGGGGGDRHRV